MASHYTCDRCGQNIKQRGLWRVKIENSAQPMTFWDLCPTCIIALRAWKEAGGIGHGENAG